MKSIVNFSTWEKEKTEVYLIIGKVNSVVLLGQNLVIPITTTFTCMIQLKQILIGIILKFVKNYLKWLTFGVVKVSMASALM